MTITEEEEEKELIILLTELIKMYIAKLGINNPRNDTKMVNLIKPNLCPKSRDTVRFDYA